jgi:hypothetical protein
VTLTTRRDEASGAKQIPIFPVGWGRRKNIAYLVHACVEERTGRQRWPPSLFRRRKGEGGGELKPSWSKRRSTNRPAASCEVSRQQTADLVVRLHDTHMASAPSVRLRRRQHRS